MTTGQLRILSINPGSRYLGVAIFDGTELCDWAVRVVKGKDIRAKRRFVRELIGEQSNRYGVSVLVLKKLNPARSSQSLRLIASEVTKFAASRGLALHEFSVGDIKARLLATERGNNRLLMEEVAARYPFLFREVQREEKNKNPYLIRMFEAVAMGIVCFNKLDSGNAKVAKTNK
jgi:hypothetical protein